MVQYLYMFGYIQPNKDELRFREFAEYRAYYCGLCKCIGREFGEPMKNVLSYDCTFMALMLCALAGREETAKCRCVYKPLSKARLAAVPDECLSFAADLDILLAWRKCVDNWQDEKKLSALAGKSAMKGAVAKAKKRRPELYEAISNGIAELSALEAENCAELDAPADAFARTMRAIAEVAPVSDAGNKMAFVHMMYHLGRWIYLIDAWDDRNKDKERGSYNPFNASDAGRDRAEFLLDRSLTEAINAYELLDIKAHGSLLDNIMLEGCPAKNKEVLGGKDEQSV